MGAVAAVFSRPPYVALSAAVFAGMLVPLLWLSGYVFFEPYLAGHAYPGTEAGLAMIVALSGMAALVIPLNAYRVASLRASGRRLSGGVLGSAMGSAAGACGCGPAGLALFSAFGASGAAASAFLTNYEMPIRAAAIAVLAASYYVTARSIRAECRIGPAPSGR